VGQKAWLINRLWTGTTGSQESIDYNLSQNDKNNMECKQAGGQKFAGKPTYKVVYFRPCNTIIELLETTASRSSTQKQTLLAIRLSMASPVIQSVRTAHSHKQVELMLRSMTRMKLVHHSFNSSTTHEMDMVRLSYHTPGQIFHSRLKNRLRNTQLTPPWLSPHWTLFLTRSSHCSLRELCLYHRQSNRLNTTVLETRVSFHFIPSFSIYPLTGTT
jgi:hypothetical protein